MMGNKKAKVGTIISVVLALALFSFFFVLAENSSDNLTLPVEDNFSFNSTLKNQTLNLTLPVNETVLINETEEVNETVILPENETTTENLSSDIETLPVANEAPTTFDSINDYSGNLIDYKIEQDGDITYLYPDMLIDELSFTTLSGSPTLLELGRINTAKHTFITTFVIDTTEATFTEGSFTKRVEGKELYLCNQWDSQGNNGCLSNWSKVQDLSGEEYTLSIQPGKTAYGETISSPSLGITSELGILAAISSTQADGLIAYGELNIALPRYRTWNSSNNFSTEQNALSLGTAGTDDITWVVTKGNHERDEIIMGTEDKSNDVNIQIYTPANNSWSNLLEVSANVLNSAYRAFDIAVEDVSGDVLIVYENSSTADTVIQYRIWNSSGYSAEMNISTGLASAVINWVQLVPRRGADDIMLLLHDSASNLYALPWNGTGFDSSKAQVLTTSSVSAVNPHFYFAWEGTINQGLVAYGLTNNIAYRTFSLTAPYWSTQATISTSPTDPNGMRLCSDPTSDYIGLILHTTANDVRAYMWDGTQILSGQPAKDPGVEPQGANNPNVDCAWINSTTTLFGFVDNNALTVDYFFFSKTNTWSTSDLTSTSTTSSFASNDIEGLRFTKHPTTSELMVTSMDIAEDITLIRWNGTAFVSVAESPIETSTEVTNGAQEGVIFDWYKYDPIPNVTSINPSNLNYAVSSTININTTITDNIAVSVVLANITLPNGTINQITLINTTNNTFYNSTFSITSLTGTYTLRIIANDSSIHNNINSSETTTFTVGDVIAPNVTNVTPITGTNYAQNTAVNISANVTDNINVSTVLANITLPNGTINQITLNNRSLINYNGTFNITGAVGTYTIRIIANDTSNNVNSSETTTFTIGDVILPTVTNLTPASGTNFLTNTVVNISANVTDNIAISMVLANITFPNGTINQIALSNRSLNIYNSTFSTTGNAGTYLVKIIANDTSNNINSSETTTFTIGDVEAPVIILNAPANASNLSSASVMFNVTVTDNIDTSLNCNLTIDGITNQTNTSVVNGSNTLFYVSGFRDGSHSWNVTCTDDTPNSNTSTTRIFTVDTGKPLFNTLTTSPNSADDLDPNVNITILANVTDNTTAVNTVILQYKLSNGSTYTNLTGVLSNGLYNASFNATQNGTYNLRVWANDTVGNSDFSNTINVRVEYDRNWTRTPPAFTAVTASASQNVAIGNITINNTGDFSFQFNITSTSSNTRYNETENFTLAAGAVKVLQINDTAPTGGLKTITLNISVNDSLATPRSQTTTGQVVVAPGQPVLVATIITPASETKSVTRGDTGVAFTATLQNIGEGNASNVTFFFTLPSDWSVTFGQTNLSVETLNAGESTENSIEVSIPSTATTGTFSVAANSTGINASGADLGNNSLIFGDTVIVTVSSVVALGSGTTGGGTSTSTSNTASATTGGGGGGTGQKVSKTILGSTTETIETEEVFSIVRGSGESTPITIANLWENAFMEDINLEASGFITQYVVISPQLNQRMIRKITVSPEEPQEFSLPEVGSHTIAVEDINFNKVTITLQSEPQELVLKKGQVRYVDLNKDTIGDLALELTDVIGGKAAINAYGVQDFSQAKLAYGEKLNYSLDIYAPAYLTQKNYELELKINAILIPINSTSAGFTSKVITELRTLIFRIHELGGEEIEVKLDQARADIQAMIDAGFFVTKVQKLFQQAEVAVKEENFETASELIEQISGVRKNAFSANEIIQQVEENLKTAQEEWLKTTQTEEALQLAQVAFERGDFTTALERAKNAQLIYVLETKGRINILKFVADWWWALLSGLIVFSLLTYFTYKRSIIIIIEQRLKNLNKEEETIQELLEETQKKYLVEKTLSEAQFKSYTAQYEKRLTKIRQLRVKLRNKRIAIFKTEQELKNISKERKELEELMKQNQEDYFVKRKISRNKFLDIDQQHKVRLTEAEQEESVLGDRLEKEKGTRKYWIFGFIQKIFNLFEGEQSKEIKNPEQITAVKEKTREKKKPVAEDKKIKEKQLAEEYKAEKKVEELKKEKPIREQKEEPINKKEKEKPEHKEGADASVLMSMFNDKIVSKTAPGLLKPISKLDSELVSLVKKQEEKKPPKLLVQNKLLSLTINRSMIPIRREPKRYYFDAGKKALVQVLEKTRGSDQLWGDIFTKDFMKTQKVPLFTRPEIIVKEIPIQKKIINLPKDQKETKPMSINELKKWFPGAFE